MRAETTRLHLHTGLLQHDFTHSQMSAVGRSLLKEETHKLTAASNADDEEDPFASDDDEDETAER